MSIAKALTDKDPSPLPLALTMGEPAGIGGEISLKAWASRKQTELPLFYIIDDMDRLARTARTLNMPVAFAQISTPEEALACFEDALPVLPLGIAVSADFGRPSPETAKATLRAIDLAMKHALAGKAGAVVTNPIQKSVLYDAGFKFQGHTDYLASLCPGKPTPVMMLACEELRVVPVTQHIALCEVPHALTTAMIVETAEITHAALARDFGIASPRLAIAGLNPHAGEDGKMGSEDEEIIRPAVAALKTQGIDARGPLPADTMFHAAARAKYDAAICMYHDQALIPIKTIAFDHAVNVTLGLPIVRTSPDHGTALDIAGKGIAKADGLIAALKLASELAATRK